MYAVDERRGKEVWRFRTSTNQQAPLEMREEIIVEPEFMEREEDEEKAEGKYESSPQVNVSESFYTPIVEYAVKDVYGTSKKKYEEM